MQRKDDKNKPLIYNMLKQFALAISQVAKCSEYGHLKYKDVDHDWENFSRIDNAYARYSNSLTRHLLEEGEDESGLNHDAHVAWNALARLEVKLRNRKKDYEDENKTN